MPGGGAPALAARRGGEGRCDLAVGALINELAGLERDLLIILDDVHAADGREVAEGLAFLLDHLPPRATWSC
ncbi:MAG: hypothetical protein U0838_01160 [Chloroflexota bacterium]